MITEPSSVIDNSNTSQNSVYPFDPTLYRVPVREPVLLFDLAAARNAEIARERRERELYASYSRTDGVEAAMKGKMKRVSRQHEQDLAAEKNQEYATEQQKCMTFCEKEAERFLKRVNPLANKKGATYEGTLLEGARTDTNADNWYYTIVQDVCSNHWKDEEGKIPKDWYGTDATANDPAPLSMVRAALRGFSEERPKRRPLSLDYVGGAERAKRARTEIMGELEKFIRQCKRGKREKGHANYCGKSAEDVLVDAGYKWNVNEGEFENATNIAQHRPPQPRTDYPKPSVDDWNSLWRKVRDLTNMKKWIGMRTGRRGTCAGFFCDTNGNTMHGWALASRSNYKTTCRLKTKINPAEGYKLNARGVAQLKPGYYVDTKDRVAKRCTSQKGCNSDGSACATGVNKTKLKCATPSTGFYVNNAGEARA